MAAMFKRRDLDFEKEEPREARHYHRDRAYIDLGHPSTGEVNNSNMRYDDGGEVKDEPPQGDASLYDTSASGNAFASVLRDLFARPQSQPAPQSQLQTMPSHGPAPVAMAPSHTVAAPAVAATPVAVPEAQPAPSSATSPDPDERQAARSAQFWGKVGQSAAKPANVAASQPGQDVIGSVTKDLIEGAQTLGQIESGHQAANLAAASQLQRDQAQIRESFDQAWKAHQARGEEIYQSILQNPVDANKLWYNAGVTGQMSALVGMSMGAMGGALMRGPNQVAQMVDKLIDRDIASQQLNQEAKSGLLHYHLEAGNQLMQARQLAKADALDGAAAQFAANGYQATSQAAAAQVQQTSAQLRLQAQQIRQQWTTQGLQQALLGAQAKSIATETALKRLQLDWMKQATQPGGGGGGQGGIPAAMLMPGGDKLLAARTGLGYVPDEKLREEVNAAVPATREALGLVNELRALRAQYQTSGGPSLAGFPNFGIPRGVPYVGGMGISTPLNSVSTEREAFQSRLDRLEQLLPVIAPDVAARQRYGITEKMVPSSSGEVVGPVGGERLDAIERALRSRIEGLAAQPGVVR